MEPATQVCPLTRIKIMTLQSTGQSSIHWSKTARAEPLVLWKVPFGKIPQLPYTAGAGWGEVFTSLIFPCDTGRKFMKKKLQENQPSLLSPCLCLTVSHDRAAFWKWSSKTCYSYWLFFSFNELSGFLAIIKNLLDISAVRGPHVHLLFFMVNYSAPHNGGWGLQAMWRPGSILRAWKKTQT